VAAVIGAMMFYGRVSDVYLGVITLVVTLILFKFMNATAGDAYRIGDVKLGGFNGIPAFPILNLPGDPNITAFGTPFYYVVCAALLLCYLLCRWILGSFFGKVLIGIRENEARVELLGYSAPLYKTAIFTISAAMAGLAGCLFANWAEIVTPGVFSLGQSAEVIIWTIVGGLGTLVGSDRRRDRPRLPEAAARPADADRQLARPRRDPDPGGAAAAERPAARDVALARPPRAAQRHPAPGDQHATAARPSRG
jgi:ABC-type branched-subunit amino acid transport system permease subunit